MLRKDLLRVSRAGGGYHPQFVGESERPLARRIIDVFQSHVGDPRSDLDDSLEQIEREAADFKLVRGFASLLDREATFETIAPVPPERARRVAFEAASDVSVADETDRQEALSVAADSLGTPVTEVETALYADRDTNQVMTAFDSRWDAATLLEQYNLSLAQTAMFDAIEIEVRSSDPRTLVSAVKRLGLMYEIHDSDAGRVVEVTGPDSLFRRTRRYGTAFARLLRTLAATHEWEMQAQIADSGSQRELRLDQTDISVPGVEPVAEPRYDSGVESDFAARFTALDLDWSLSREPEPLRTGSRVMIPDFAFDYEFGDFRVFFEIMGFWTPEYVEKKLAQLADLEDVDMIVAVDESLGVGEEIKDRDQRVTEYTGTVGLKEIVDILREYETGLTEKAAGALPEQLLPEEDVVELGELSAEYGVSEDVIVNKQFPNHRVIGRTLVKPAVLEQVETVIESGMDLATAETALADRDITDTSAALSALGYRVAWEGLSGGTIQQKEPAE